jgi:hypothetical protein
MNIKTILLTATISLAVLPGVSYATPCTDAMALVAAELNDLNQAIASGNLKAIFRAQRDYFNAVEGANTVCEHDWIGGE